MAKPSQGDRPKENGEQRGAARAHIETLAVHAGRDIDPHTGAVMPPIHLATTFARNAEGETPAGFVYTRSDNPNRRALEDALTALEGGAAAAAFASGQAATMSVLQTLGPGDHVLMPDSLYFGTQALVRQLFGAWRLAYTFVDMRDLDALRGALRPTTRLIWVETPSNPLLKITDIRAVAALASAHGARCVVDNTWATPINQRPLELGAHAVMHATTKFLGGHSDLLGGALIVAQADDWFQRIRAIQEYGGAVPSPFDCWLLLRSLRTLPYRIRAHNANALAVAQALSRHPKIETVYYPGLDDFPDRDVVQAQMQGCGGMMSILVRGDAAAARRLAGATRYFTQATSLGGVESLIEHRASVEGPGSKTPPNLLRLSIGLEHSDDLVADLQQALAAI